MLSFKLTANLPDGFYLTIMNKDKEEPEDCYEYFEALLHMVDGLRNLDNFLIKRSMNMRDINLGAWRFVKTKGIDDDVDIDEALRNWKELVKNAPNRVENF